MATLTRLVKTEPGTISTTFYVGETATAPTGTPTYTVTAADGVSVQTGSTTVNGTTVSFTLAGISTLELLTVVWTAVVSGSTRTQTDYVEIVGQRFFSEAQGRASDSSLSDTSKYTTADLTLALLEVEQECEAICDRAFTPQYARIVLDGTGTSEVLLEHPGVDRSMADVRSIRSVTMAPRADDTFTAFTAGELAAVQVTEDMLLRRVDGAAWTEGLRNVVVELEYGLDAPPPDLRRAALVRFRSRLNIHKSGVPDRAISWSADGGGTYRIDLPDAFKTGIPEVDGPYSRYSRRQGSGTGETGRNVPASRTLSYEPQHWSLYHR